jgi:hypothetical protein
MIDVDAYWQYLELPKAQPTWIDTGIGDTSMTADQERMMAEELATLCNRYGMTAAVLSYLVPESDASGSRAIQRGIVTDRYNLCETRPLETQKMLTDVNTLFKEWLQRFDIVKGTTLLIPSTMTIRKQQR